jgi:putative SOS response-associated peptidase YedK
VCGRLTLHHSGRDLAAAFGSAPNDLAPRYNVAPTQRVPVLHAPSGIRTWSSARWGLIPAWVEDPARYRALSFNARAETAAEKPSFRDALVRGRALLPASGFYEWRTRGEPWYVTRRDGAPLALAALIACRSERDPPCSVAILTTTASPGFAALHDRMPVILAAADVAAWLDPRTPPAAVAALLLRPAADEALLRHPVAAAVGSVAHDDPSLIAPLPGA